MIEAILIEGDLTVVSCSPENLEVSRCGRWFDTGAVSHAAEKRIIHEVSFVQVRREHYELLKRHFNFFPIMQCKKVDAPLERHDPPIKQISRRDSLSTKVIDNQRPSVGL